jgi:hypothetical protein
MSPAKSRGTKISNPCRSSRETGELSVPKRRPVRRKSAGSGSDWFADSLLEGNARQSVSDRCLIT